MKTNKIKLLIVENNHDEVVLINELLRAAFGQAVEVIDQAESYKIAIDLLKQKNYDVCLCDYRRDGLNGIEFLREVRGKKNIAPVVFLADQIDQEVAVGAIKAGAADYLNKANLTHEMLGKSVLHAIQLFREEEGRRLTQNELEKKNHQKELILNSSGEGIFVLDSHGHITFINPAACMMLGYDSSDLIGKNAHNAIHHSRIDGSPFPKEQCPYYVTLTSGESQHVEEGVFWRENETFFPVEYISNPIKESEKVIGVVVTFKDITKRKRSDDMIKNLAYHDGLTGLPNRILLYDRINQALTHAQRYKEMLAILFVDLDDFKPVNDKLGHAIGDLVLQELANRLKGCLREGDTVARLGGDEFVVLLNKIARQEDVSLTVQKLLNTIKPVFILGSHHVYLGASIGVALYPNDGKNRDTLLKNADLALYRAKQKGKNCFELHAPH